MYTNQLIKKKKKSDYFQIVLKLISTHWKLERAVTSEPNEKNAPASVNTVMRLSGSVSISVSLRL